MGKRKKRNITRTGSKRPDLSPQVILGLEGIILKTNMKHKSTKVMTIHARIQKVLSEGGQL